MPLNLEELKQPPFYHEMILVEGGSFMMGNEDEDDGDEQPIHKVAVPTFQIAKYPVTQALWKAVMGNNPSYFIGDSRPVEQVSWHRVHVFIQKIKEKTGMDYRLPSEAEWEYAARGGQNTKGCKYAGGDIMVDVGWHCENSLAETRAVGLLRPNELGLYDMSGHVWEWCQDHWRDNYIGAPEDGSAWEGLDMDSDRAYRGGSWFDEPEHCSPSSRYHWDPDTFANILGFRLAASVEG